MRINQTEREMRKWWSINEALEEDINFGRCLIRAAVQDHLVADTPVATLLSGGLDSSIVALEAAREMAKDPPICFTGVVAQEGYDESGFASEVTELLGLRHTLVPLPSATDFDLVNRLIAVRCHPLGMHNEAAMYLLASAVAPEFKVMLTGEGADEIFAGYSRIYRLPFDLRRSAWADFLPNVIGSPLRRRLELPTKGTSEFDFFLSRYSYFPIEEKISLATLSWRDCLDGDKELIAWMRDSYMAGANTPERRVSSFFINHHLPALLEMVDNTTMAAGVEARVPFTDHRLVVSALRLPPSATLRWKSRFHHMKALTEPVRTFSEVRDVSKAALRDIYSRCLPQSVLSRKKLGFPLPLGAWAAGDSSRAFKQQLFSDDAHISRYLDSVALRGWFNSNSQSPTDTFGRQFWLLSNLETFLRQI